MRVFIVCAEADQGCAEELKEFLKPWGMFAEVESGVVSLRHLQRSDVLIALWSRNALFGSQRMNMERRMLDAWSHGQLILVTLDHHFLPVGLRDLPSIDGTFASARSTVTWRSVQREARDRINQLLVQGQEAQQEAKIDHLSASSEPEAILREKEEGKGIGTEEDPLFVSYAHADLDLVSPVVSSMEGGGKSVWMDRGEITAGESWAGEIVRGIKAACGVMVMCSPRAFESDHIKREVYLADRYRKSMLPIFVAQAEPPEDFEYFFAGVQWLELYKVEESKRDDVLERALAKF
ncbi:MAG: toll/interleukin-1 receptor domain-containing protein [Verrucomicrobiota bacterium]